jgi:hypothetical protein
MRRAGGGAAGSARGTCRSRDEAAVRSRGSSRCRLRSTTARLARDAGGCPHQVERRGAACSCGGACGRDRCVRCRGCERPVVDPGWSSGWVWRGCPLRGGACGRDRALRLAVDEVAERPVVDPLVERVDLKGCRPWRTVARRRPAACRGGGGRRRETRTEGRVEALSETSPPRRRRCRRCQVAGGCCRRELVRSKG